MKKGQLLKDLWFNIRAARMLRSVVADFSCGIRSCSAASIHPTEPPWKCTACGFSPAPFIDLHFVLVPVSPWLSRGEDALADRACGGMDTRTRTDSPLLPLLFQGLAQTAPQIPLSCGQKMGIAKLKMDLESSAELGAWKLKPTPRIAAIPSFKATLPTLMLCFFWSKRYEFNALI